MKTKKTKEIEETLIINVSKEMIEHILPSNIKESDAISNESKKVLATIMNYFLVLSQQAKEGYIYLTNSKLRKSLNMSQTNMMNALQELQVLNLIKREAGKKREQGQKAQASRYTVLWNNLNKPLKKSSFEDLFSQFLEPTKDISGTVVVDADVVSVIDAVSDTVTDTASVSDTVLVSDTVSAKVVNSEELNNCSKVIQPLPEFNKGKSTFFEQFKERIETELHGKTASEVDDSYYTLLSDLRGQRAVIGNTTFNRTLSYLRKRKEELYALIET